MSPARESRCLVFDQRPTIISITENGAPLENAISERVNGIIKEEYLNHYQTDKKGYQSIQQRQATHEY